ncbi:MAG: metalloregulator ArsR/SmtB family transcription factor [Gammaproteobacteria bacterium]|nr:metalloregulator ArsR/SmtB family transcription factor [Gammaproteobacteria bacterium]
MNEGTAVSALAALGHEARLRIFRLLVRAGHEGLNIGEIGHLVGLPASTLAHHLRALVDVGLVTQQRHSRQVINRADFDVMNGVLAFVAEECCKGISLVEDDVA